MIVCPPIPDRDTLPAELVGERRFLIWRYGDARRNGRRGKVPCNRDGRPVDPAERRRWLHFEQARAAAFTHGLGVGLGLAPEFGDVALDLDGCRDPATGRLSAVAEAIVYNRLAGTFAEASPSGTGVRLLARGQLDPLGRTQGKVPGMRLDGAADSLELYPLRPGFITLTGRRLPGTSGSLLDHADSLIDLQKSLGPAKPSAPCRSPLPARLVFDGDIPTLLARVFAAKRGDALRRLWHGDTSGFPSFSEAALSLANGLAPWVSGDALRLFELLSGAPLVRDDPRALRKWRKRYRGRPWGLVYVAEKAVDRCTTVIDGLRPSLPKDSPLSCGCNDLHGAAAAGRGGLKAAMAAVRAGWSAPGFGLGDTRGRVASLCYHLSRFHPDGWFYLACTDAGEELGVHYATASRHLLALAAGVQPIILRLTSGTKASGHASEYRWIGPTVPSA